jgi:cell division septum initiation protein DivIVA
MTQSQPAERSMQVPAESIVGMEFPATKYGRGYDRRAVREYLEHIGGVVGGLQQRLHAAEAEVERLQKRVIEGPRGEEVIQAVSVISNAQRTADSIIAEANSYSSRVMSEAHAAYDDARRRGAQLEQEAEGRVRELTLSSKVHQEELDKQTAYLRTLRDATRTQMQKFLEGLLFHVAEEYGRAHPIAAQAAEADRGGYSPEDILEAELGASASSESEESRNHSPNGLASVGAGPAGEEHTG